MALQKIARFEEKLGQIAFRFEFGRERAQLLVLPQKLVDQRGGLRHRSPHRRKENLFFRLEVAFEIPAKKTRELLRALSQAFGPLGLDASERLLAAAQREGE